MDGRDVVEPSWARRSPSAEVGRPLRSPRSDATGQRHVAGHELGRSSPARRRRTRAPSRAMGAGQATEARPRRVGRPPRRRGRPATGYQRIDPDARLCERARRRAPGAKLTASAAPRAGRGSGRAPRRAGDGDLTPGHGRRHRQRVGGRYRRRAARPGTYARVFAVARPTRSPVKEPGPVPDGDPPEVPGPNRPAAE